eukprot:31479-Pelagococcus_subviridis.AAC.25
MRSIFVLPGKSQHSHVVSHIVRRARGRQISAAACQVQSYGPLCRSSVVLLKRRTNLDVQNALLARYHRHYFKYEDRRQMMSFQSHACHKPTFDAANGRYTESFLLVRWTVFLSLTFTAPAMVASPSLGLDITSIGVITSIFPLCYGCSKFVSGVVGDTLSPGVMLGGGLIATGMVNIAFGASSTLPLFCILWATNGVLQGFGAPSCAKILTSWFAAKERGTYWGMWNIAHNLGGFAAPLLAGTAARTLGWNWGLWAPGIVALLVGSVILSSLKDSPEARGYEPVEELRGISSQSKPKFSLPALIRFSMNTYSYRAVGTLSETVDKDSVEKFFTSKVTCADLISLIPLGASLSHIFVFTSFVKYVVHFSGFHLFERSFLILAKLRTLKGITSWSVFYLIKEKGVIDAGAAAVRVSGLELGGLLGSLIAGRISDWYIAQSSGGAVGKRIQIVMAYLIGVATMLIAFKAVPAGFFLYGPQMLIGLCGAEIVGRRSVGASEGFLGWIAYLESVYFRLVFTPSDSTKWVTGCSKRRCPPLLTRAAIWVECFLCCIAVCVYCWDFTLGPGCWCREFRTEKSNQLDYAFSVHSHHSKLTLDGMFLVCAPLIP